MTSKEFADLRKKLKKTQQQISELLGTSVKAVRSYEQGWRTIPTHVERQMFFLVSQMNKPSREKTPCWILKKCPENRKKRCPAWEFQTGELCWFINGTICEGVVRKNWNEKMKLCRSCEVLMAQIT
ncbi:MAG: helix-turn-helix domain-containing protein [Deltaproteobacteria bacterium]|nr:helix-turn-helix domain-containing protein [Deltaproteobacteria bacterium]MBW1993235.1 helix-turn-helix domain-containing protein [Deltaproteobacteria bacterium]MBW2154128.1 helix-turn-helix domain-containing protein [Deltaproteobacteria bacterium]